MIDKDKISANVAEIKTAVETLKGYREIDKETFLASPLIIRDTKYSFIIAGQASIDICYHLTARLLKKAPTGYGDCFELSRRVRLLLSRYYRKDVSYGKVQRSPRSSLYQGG